MFSIYSWLQTDGLHSKFNIRKLNPWISPMKDCGYGSFQTKWSVHSVGCCSHNTAGSEFSAKPYEEHVLAWLQFSAPYTREFNIPTAFAWPQRHFGPWVSAPALISTSLLFSELKILIGSSASRPASVLFLLLLAVTQHETLCGLRFPR